MLCCVVLCCVVCVCVREREREKKRERERECTASHLIMHVFMYFCDAKRSLALFKLRVWGGGGGEGGGKRGGSDVVT